jgi:hypothetical protein
MKSKLFVLFMLILGAPMAWAHATGSCTATAVCKYGTASCTVSAASPSDSREPNEVFCGQRIPGERFLACGGIAGGLVSIKHTVCCDATGAALHSVSEGGVKPPNTSSCVSTSNK